MSFTTAAARQKVVVMYNATCKTSGPNYLYLQIKVDGQPTNPNVDAVFCSASSNPSEIATSRQVIYTVPNKGTHSVTATLTVSEPDANFYLVATSIVVAKWLEYKVTTLSLDIAASGCPGPTASVHHGHQGFLEQRSRRRQRPCSPAKLRRADRIEEGTQDDAT